MMSCSVKMACTRASMVTVSIKQAVLWEVARA